MKDLLQTITIRLPKPLIKAIDAAAKARRSKGDVVCNRSSIIRSILFAALCPGSGKERGS